MMAVGKMALTLAEETQNTTSEYSPMKESGLLVAEAYSDTCEECWDKGWVIRSPEDRPPGEGWGLRAWYDDGVAPNKIRWCECAKGTELREQYELAYQKKRQKYVSGYFKAAGIPGRYTGLTLETFREQPTGGKEAGIAAAAMYIDKGYVVPAELPDYGAPEGVLKVRRPTSKRFSLFYFGEVGVGKTGLLSSVFRHIVESGQPGLWIQYSDFVMEVQGGYADGTADTKLRTAQTVPVLFLDDLGSEALKYKETDDKRLILWQLISHRHGEDLPTFITSNLQPARLRSQFENRIIDRIEEMAMCIPVRGQNLREV